MKKLLLTLISAVLALTAAAELREDAFVIRTTDGAAQGLLFGDIEKITFSNLDDEGIPHTGIYYQEMHYPDTIVRVPVTDITEVSFEKPRVKYQPDVILCTETGLFDYLYSVYETETEQTLVFRETTPDHLLPKVGQIITYFKSDNKELDYSPYAGRVKNILRFSQSQILVETEQIEDIGEIYEELIGVEAIGNDSPGVREALRRANALPKNDKDNAPRRIEVSGGGTLPKVDFDISLGYSYDPTSDNIDNPWEETNTGVSFGFHGGIKGSFELRLAYEFSSTRKFLSVGSTYEYTKSFSADFTAEASWTKVFGNNWARPIIEITAPSAPIFTIGFTANPFIKLSGSASAKYTKTYPTVKARTLAYYIDGLYRSGKCDVNDPADAGLDNSGSSEFTISFDGSLHFGISMGLCVSTQRILKTTLGIGAAICVGPKFTGTIGITPGYSWDKTKPNTSFHDIVKDWSYSATWCTMDVELVFFREVVSHYAAYTFGSMSFDILEPYTRTFVPQFEAPTLEIPYDEGFDKLKNNWWGSTTAKIPLNFAEDCNSYYAVYPGVAVYDENDNFLWSDYINEFYTYRTKNDSVFQNIQFEFANWEPSKTYKLYPAYKKDGQQFRAEPVRTVKVADGILTTGDCEIVKEEKGGSFTLYGTVNDVIRICPVFQYSGFIYAEDPSLLSIKISESGRSLEFKEGVGGESCWVTDPESFKNGLISATSKYSSNFYNKTYYYRTYAWAGNTIYYGEIKSFTIPEPDEDE